MRAPYGCCDDHDYDRDLAMAEFCTRAAYREALRNQSDDEVVRVLRIASYRIALDLLCERGLNRRQADALINQLVNVQ